MRGALWLLALFAMAVGAALFATQSEGTVTLYWPPYRIDLSLNLVLLALLALFVLLHLALCALSALFELPAQAKQWRRDQRELAMHANLQAALGHQLAGRFSRARKLALQCVQHAGALQGSVPHTAQVRALAHLLVAESAQSLQDIALRDSHLQAALEVDLPSDAQHLRDGAALRATRWALDDADPDAALNWLTRLSQGAQRRTLALRFKLRGSQLAAHHGDALETARLLAKHGAFSGIAAQGLLRSLAQANLAQMYDADQLMRWWQSLPNVEKSMPDIATRAAQRLCNLSAGQANAAALQVTARQWIEPLWPQYLQLGESQRNQLLQAVEASQPSLDASWLARIESAQRQQPRDAPLQLLAGHTYMQRALWGKAQQAFETAIMGNNISPTDAARAWRGLAALAEQRGDEVAAARAWKLSATLTTPS